VKFAELAPAATVTLGGTVAAALLLANVTAVAAWAGALNVTVPVEDAPPITDVGLSDKPARVGVGLGPGVAVELIRTRRLGLAPPTSKAMSGFPSPLKSLDVMKMPPMLDCGGGTR
jgi:hypothetical protein